MTEHSIEELKKQYEAAVSRAAQAEKDRREAGHRYTQKAIADKLTEFAARGIRPGMKVRLEVEKWGSKIDYLEAGFLGVKAGYVTGQTRPIVTKLKKDGTISKREWSIYFSGIEPIDDAGKDSTAQDAAA